MFRKRSWDMKAQTASSRFHGLLSTRLTAHVIIYALGWEELGWEGPAEAPGRWMQRSQRKGPPGSGCWDLSEVCQPLCSSQKRQPVGEKGPQTAL